VGTQRSASAEARSAVACMLLLARNLRLSFCTQPSGNQLGELGRDVCHRILCSTHLRVQRVEGMKLFLPIPNAVADQRVQVGIRFVVFNPPPGARKPRAKPLGGGQTPNPTYQQRTYAEKCGNPV
jgi:hypothetical protein